MVRRTLVIPILTILVVAVSSWFVYGSRATQQTHTVSSAMWVSRAVSVEEVMKEADLVVRARVREAPVAQVIRQELPLTEFRNGTPVTVGSTTSEAVFSDTVFDIVQVYTGKAPNVLMVMQTGGSQPGNPRNITETSDDPLYKVGEEYVLFLVDISGDPIQAPGRSLYRIVNPSGRYRVTGNTVQFFAQELSEQQRARVMPSKLAELEAQILQHSTK
jgi:hypothetical protein